MEQVWHLFTFLCKVENVRKAFKLKTDMNLMHWYILIALLPAISRVESESLLENDGARSKNTFKVINSEKSLQKKWEGKQGGTK